LNAHLCELRRTMFVLWRPWHTWPAPRLLLGWFRAGNPPALVQQLSFDLAELPGHPGLWGIAAADCGLGDGNVYHYWFEVTDSSPYRDGRRILCTDPLAHTVDWRLRAAALGPPYGDDDRDPASVVRYLNGELVACDAAGEAFVPAPLLPTALAPPNARLVIYELPTSWTRSDPNGDPLIGVGTFRDAAALVEDGAAAANFAGVPALEPGRSHLLELGVNALELLPPADSFVDREWGYATSNYLAPDYDLGFPSGHASPTANGDLIALVTLCHAHGIRFLLDLVMAFGTRAPLENVNFPEFHIDPAAEPDDPDARQSGGQGVRRGFGGQLWRYAKPAFGYDPLDGAARDTYPARQLMKLALLRWMADFTVDGLRLDSVNNVASWDFVEEIKDLARACWAGSGSLPDRFLVVGEELSVPKDLLAQGRLDALWNEDWKRMARCAILGRNADAEPSFEWTVKKLVDCRLLGFTSGVQAVNYLGTHDVEGFRNERLHNFLLNNGVPLTEERIKLAFVCLLTAVGIPMILAGDEFADQHDLGTGNPAKQRDAVNFERVDEPWRRRVFEYVARLVALRTRADALAGDEVAFLHADFDDGKRVLVWRRGAAASAEPVIVLANFSDFTSRDIGHGGEYRVPAWPATPPGRRWREVTQQRDVPEEWIGREPIYAWEAKVYTTVPL
jgi:pullulanase